MAAKSTASVRGNSVPSGGVTATTTGSGASTRLLPDTDTLRRASEVFMESSENNCIPLNKVGLIPGQQVSFTINNIGLGESLELFVKGDISFANTAAAPQDINVAPEFPFNIISQIISQFNGQTVLNSLSGYELLGIMAKRGKEIFRGAQSSSGAAQDVQNNATVDKTIAFLKAGSNVTLTTGTPALTGVTKVTVAASTTGTISFGCYLRLPYTMRDDLLLGLIPMQNNSINLNIFISTPAILGATPTSPFYVIGGVPTTLTNSANSISVQPTYNFWALPTGNNASIYSYLIAHSYMLLAQPNMNVNAVGTEALQYNMPNNYYLMGMLFTLRDSGGHLMNVQQSVNFPYISYNGTARVDRKDIDTRLARQSLFYEGIPSGLGQLLWDATDVSYLTNGANTAKWLDMYLANNPQFIMDIQNGVNAPVTYSALREQLVPANVQIL